MTIRIAQPISQHENARIDAMMSGLWSIGVDNFNDLTELARTTYPGVREYTRTVRRAMKYIIDASSDHKMPSERMPEFTTREKKALADAQAIMEYLRTVQAETQPANHSEGELEKLTVAKPYLNEREITDLEAMARALFPSRSAVDTVDDAILCALKKNANVPMEKLAGAVADALDEMSAKPYKPASGGWSRSENTRRSQERGGSNPSHGLRGGK